MLVMLTFPASDPILSEMPLRLKVPVFRPVMVALSKIQPALAVTSKLSEPLVMVSVPPPRAWPVTLVRLTIVPPTMENALTLAAAPS